MNTTLRSTGVALRRVDCGCGFVWLSPPSIDPIVDGAPNVCPKCSTPALRGTVGPVRHFDLDLPLDIGANTSARVEK